MGAALPLAGMAGVRTRPIGWGLTECRLIKLSLRQVHYIEDQPQGAHMLPMTGSSPSGGGSERDVLKTNSASRVGCASTPSDRWLE